MIMKKLYTLMLLSIFGIPSVFGQHKPTTVEPGCKGQLPTVVAPAKGDGSFLPILYMQRIYTYYFTYGGDNIYEPSIDCYFTEAKEFGGEYYELEFLKKDNWVNTYYEGDDVTKLTGYNFGVRMHSDVTAYRLKLVGGPKDGMYSNVIEARFPSVMTSGDMGESQPSCNNRVGFEEDAPYIRNVKVNGKVFADFEQYLRYNWYRRNPNTYEMTPIEGAHSKNYTFTLEDVGYDVVGEICGDREHIDFSMRKEIKNICIPLFCSTEYARQDGVILNTDYILPDPNVLSLGNYDYSDGTQQWKEYEIKSVTERKPGQYVIKADTEDFYFISAKGYVTPYFGYEMNFGEETEIMVREAMVNLYEDYGTIVVKHNDNLASATIDVMHYNIDGEIVVDTTFTSGEKEHVINAIPGQYFIRAHATDNTVATYYPSATRWDDAVALDLPCRNESTDWRDSLFVLTLLDKPATMEGEGVIEGKLIKLQSAGNAPKRIMSYAAAESMDLNVLLYDKAGKLIATTTVAADGVYRFDHVPFGSYVVVADVAGYSVVEPANVTLTAEQPTVTNVDYSMTDDGKIVNANATGIQYISTSISDIPAYDLMGRRISGKTQGILIINGRKAIY